MRFLTIAFLICNKESQLFFGRIHSCQLSNLCFELLAETAPLGVPAVSFIAFFTGVAAIFSRGLANTLLFGVKTPSLLGVALSSDCACWSSLKGFDLLRKRIACAALIFASSPAASSKLQALSPTASSSIAGAKREKNGASTN
jgi:hypothetical protein